MLGGAAGAVPAVVDVPVIKQRRRVSRTVKVPQIQFIAGVSGHSSFATETGTHNANCAACSLGAVYGGWSGDDGVFWTIKGLFSRSIRTLSARLALNDEEFFVIEGSGVAGTPGV